MDIPANTRAVIYLPTPDPKTVALDGTTGSGIDGLDIKTSPDGYAYFETGSGKYHFTCRLK